jgi:hypothetical protein
MNTASNPLDSLREIVLSLFPWLLKLGTWTYRVDRVNADGTLDLAPTSAIPPRLPSVPQWLVGGVEVTPLVGSLVGVVYLDASTPGAKPVPAIVAFAPLRESVPTGIAIGGTSAPAAARAGDHAGRLTWDASLATLYYSPSDTAAYAPVTSVLVPMTPPSPTDPGTTVAIATGSSRVTIA